MLSGDNQVFKRDGKTLFMEKEISLLEALCGVTFTVKHLDGRTLLVKFGNGQVVKPGDLKEIADEGMPTWKQPFDKGPLVIKFNVKFPDYVNPQSKPVRQPPAVCVSCVVCRVSCRACRCVR